MLIRQQTTIYDRDLLKLWGNENYLCEIEKHTSKVAGHTVQQLASELTAYEKSQPNYLHKLQNEESYKITVAMSYAIFTWISTHITYDDQMAKAIKEGILRKEELSLSSILRSKHTICQGYSKLFEAISLEAGMEATIISGYSKSFEEEILNSGHYKPFTLEPHCWNAVSILCIIYVAI